MPRDDPTLLRNMVDAAEVAIGFAKGLTRADLDHDLRSAYAIVRAMEIVGEATGRVSPEARAQISDLPWCSIVGMRNKLIHAYFDVDLDVVWDTVTNDFPLLIAAIDTYLTNPR